MKVIGKQFDILNESSTLLCLVLLTFTSLAAASRNPRFGQYFNTADNWVSWVQHKVYNVITSEWANGNPPQSDIRLVTF